MPFKYSKDRRAYQRAWRKANLDKSRTSARNRHRKLKRDIIRVYGGRCACCREQELIFLTIDHVAGGGNQHRKKLKVGGGSKFYYWLRSNNYPLGFQVLCMNCQFGTRFRKTCPHKLSGLRHENDL